MKNIAIIPARSGSKGLKDKNIKDLCGKPLLAYTIEAAIRSGMFDEVMVSTDSVKYADIAKKYGASVPFYRSKANSSDSASSWDVVAEILDKYEHEFDTFCLLQPTSPLRTDRDIVGAYELYNLKRADAVVSVCECEHSPLWCSRIDSNGIFCDIKGNRNLQQRQALEKYYRLNGAIYIVNINKFNCKTDIYASNCYPYIMRQESSIDIDSIRDFKMAEIILADK